MVTKRGIIPLNGTGEVKAVRRPRTKKAGDTPLMVAPAVEPAAEKPARPMSAPVPMRVVDQQPAPTEGPRTSQIQGMPHSVMIHLEPATFPEKAQWKKGVTGLLLGVAVPGPDESIVAYNTVPIPTVTGARKATVFLELAAEQEGIEAAVELRYLDREGNGLCVPSRDLVQCSRRPILAYPISLAQLGRTLTVAIVIRPRGAYPVIVRCAWAEIEA